MLLKIMPYAYLEGKGKDQKTARRGFCEPQRTCETQRDERFVRYEWFVR
jgi:hypothetical protein